MIIYTTCAALCFALGVTSQRDGLLRGLENRVAINKKRADYNIAWRSAISLLACDRPGRPDFLARGMDQSVKQSKSQDGNLGEVMSLWSA